MTEKKKVTGCLATRKNTPAPKGNRYGARTNRMWGDAVLRAVKRRQIDGPDGLNALADKLLDLCLEGDMAAFKEFGNRIDGLVTVRAEISGPDGGPIAVSPERPQLTQEQWLEAHGITLISKRRIGDLEAAERPADLGDTG